METRWGRRFGRYEVIAEVGRGAMGVVYKARDPKIDRFVAVKTISLSNQDPEEERQYRERFFHEAQAAGRLLHPGIVTIFDTGEDQESHIAFIVMEFIAGQSLDRYLSDKNKKLPLDTALRFSAELAEALDHAHGQGVVHRDIKPANILVTPEEHTKIADFGIAKVNRAQLTLPGRALGTPAYMSPEQLEGEPVDKRSDLFSLGAILYHMVTGFGPFQGNSATTVCFKVANRDPLRASAFDPDVPKEVDSIIARAMAKDPAQRYQRGLEFALDLHEVRARCQALSSRATGATQFAGPRLLGDVITHVPPSNRVPAGIFKTLRHTTRQLPTLIATQVSSCWRRRAVRLGLAFSVATIISGSIAYHKSLQSQHSKQIGSSVSSGTFGANAPAPAMSQPIVTGQGAGKLSDSPARSTVADSTLDIQIEHRFSSADLSLWIDDKLAFDRPLRGQVKKRWNPFRKDVPQTEAVRLAAGEHRILVRVRSTPDKYEQSASIVGSFSKDRASILKINFERHRNAMRLALYSGSVN